MHAWISFYKSQDFHKHLTEYIDSNPFVWPADCHIHSRQFIVLFIKTPITRISLCFHKARLAQIHMAYNERFKLELTPLQEKRVTARDALEVVMNSCVHTLYIHILLLVFESITNEQMFVSLPRSNLNKYQLVI